nr:MAG TPA: hypothetical protein [Caudoviricetes sp.]
MMCGIKIFKGLLNVSPFNSSSCLQKLVIA